MNRFKKCLYVFLFSLVFLTGCGLTVTTTDVSKITLENQTFSYDGSAKSLEASNVSSGVEVVYDNNSHTDIGVYYVTAECFVNSILKKSLTATLTIEKGNFNTQDIVLNDKTIAFDGSVHNLSVEGNLPTGTIITYDNNSQKDVGVHTVTATVSHIDGYYNDLVLTATLTITGAIDTSNVEFKDKTFLFDDTIKFVTVSNLPSGVKVVYENNSKSEVGDYIVTAKLYSSTDTLLDTLTAKLNIVENNSTLIDSIEQTTISTSDSSWSFGNGVSTTFNGDNVIDVTAGTSAGSNRITFDSYSLLTKISFSYYAPSDSSISGGIKLYSVVNGTTCESIRMKIEGSSVKFTTSASLNSSNNLTSATTTTIGSVNLDEWNDFELVLYNSNETKADVYLNSNKLNSTSLNTPFQIDNITSMNFFTDSNKTGNYYIKDISIGSFVFDDLGTLENGSEDNDDNDENEGNVLVASTNAEIKTMIPKLNPGETLIIEDGVYNDFGYFKINGHNATADNEIIIRARNIGGAVFTGTCSFQIFSDYVTVSGLSFKDGQAYPQDTPGELANVDDQNASYVFEMAGNYQRISHVTIDNFNDMYIKTTYITVTNEALYAEIDNCNFLNKSSAGVLLLVERDTAGGINGVMYTHIHNNYFFNYTNPAPTEITNGLEAMRLGSSNVSTWYTCALIENNVFEDISTEPELISVKSCGNVIRGNVVINSDSAITLRHGTENIVDSNVILNDGISDGNGIRVFDCHHLINNNYISGVTSTSEYDGGIILHNGTENASPSGAWQVYEVILSNNTIVNSVENIGLGDNKYDIRPVDVTLKNNFVYSGNEYAIRLISSNGTGTVTATFENEWYYSSKSTWYTNVSTDIFDPTTSGVTFSKVLDNYISKDGEFFYHSEAGATNLSTLRGDTVVSTVYSSRSNLTKEQYATNFDNWPFTKGANWIFN